jgi:prolyl-tRNA synthetase
MLEVGLLRPCANGTFYILPLLQRSVEQFIKIIDHHLSEIDCQKLSLPILTSADLWKKSGRFDTAKAELMLTKDRHDKMHILSPVSDY